MTEVNTVLLLIVIGIIIAQTVWKHGLYKNEASILVRVEALLTANEVHSRLNQENKTVLKSELEKMKAETKIAASTTANVAREAKEEIKTAVAEVPKKVVEEIKETAKANESTDSLKVILPDPNKL